MASLYALHIKVTFSPTKTVAFDLGRTTGLARTRSTKEENRYADIIKKIEKPVSKDESDRLNREMTNNITT